MQTLNRFTGMGGMLALGAALVLTGCGIDGVLGRDQGRVRVVLSNDAGAGNASASSTLSPAAPAADRDDDDDDDHDRGHRPWWFESANVTISSILVRSLDGELVHLDVDLPVVVDVVRIEGGKQVLLPDGLLPTGTYDQVVLVMTSVQGQAPDGSVITLEPPGGGWTAVIPICALEIAEGSTTTVGISLNVRNSFAWFGNRWSFHPRFRRLGECAAG